MKKQHIKDMTRGWFVGNFDPSVHKTNDVEVGVKHFKKGEVEERHYHKIATEITVIIRGEVMMGDNHLREGDILTVHQNESSDFRALTDGSLVVVKIPGANNDKYLGKSERE